MFNREVIYVLQSIHTMLIKLITTTIFVLDYLTLKYIKVLATVWFLSFVELKEKEV